MKDFVWKVSLVVAMSWSLTACLTTQRQRPIYNVKVEVGDTLASLASRYDTRWDEIARLNGMKPGEPLKIGRVLRIKPGPGGVVATDEAAALPETAKFKESDYPEVAIPQGKKTKGGLFFGKGKESAALTWPVYGSLSSYYGKRHGRFHHGIDVRARKGTLVLPAAPGTVEFAGRQSGYGKVVIVRHENLKTLYAHLKSISVTQGQGVDRNTELGETGTTGHVSGPHLHFEVRSLANQSMNPLDYLATDQLLVAEGTPR